MVEQTNTGECHRHSVFVAHIDHVVVTDRSARLRDILYAALVGTFDIVAEREEGVTAQHHSAHLGEEFRVRIIGTALATAAGELVKHKPLAEERGEKLLIVLLDGITDPHNLGAIIRSAECFGAHGIVIPKHRSVSVNDTVVKVASGATEHMLVAKVTNINDTIRELKERNVWVYACAFDGKPPKCADFKDNTAIVVGSEGDGIKRLTKELCDDTVTIPEFGKINSLNASVAAGVVLYEAARQRH